MLVAGLLLTSAALLGTAGGQALRGPDVPDAVPVALRPPPAPAPEPEPRRTIPSPVAAPVSLVVPALGLDVPLGRLGLQDDGTVEVPADADDAGWFRLGPAPGAPGSAVVLGHVDSRRGPGVFFRLRELQVGDDVRVSRSDGSVARFTVTGVQTYRKDAFPAELVYGGSSASTLQLVTCGGEFDRAARSYLSNVVVSADLVPPTPAVSA